MKTFSTVRRMGFGAMQLSGPHIFGPPADPDECRRVLLRAVELGVDHIDTSDFYGPYVVNDLIRETLAPYSDDLFLVTKVGGRRDDEGNWLPRFEPDEIRAAVEENLERLGLDRIGGVNLRVMPEHHQGSITAQWEVLAQLQADGLVGEIGLSTVTGAQVAEAQAVAPVACVQNLYNLVQREDDALVADLAAQGIAYVPYFPLGGFTPLDFDRLQGVADKHDATTRQVALAWLLQHSPNILLIPGTSTVAHLEQNLAAADLELDDDDVAHLNTLAG